MKRVVHLVSAVLFSLILISCGTSMDDMIEAYNGQLSIVSADGTTYTENGKDFELSTLIPYSKYEVKQGYLTPLIEANRGYSLYNWKMTDSSGNEVTGYSTDVRAVRLNTRSLGLELGDYTMTCVATSVTGKTYRDSVTLSVISPE